MSKKAVDEITKMPNFTRKYLIGNNQINNSQYFKATVCKPQSNLQNDDLNQSKTDKESKNILKNYLLIVHNDSNALLINDFNLSKIRKSYVLQQKLGMLCPSILPIYQIFDEENEKKILISTKFPTKGILSTLLPGFAAYPNHMCSFHKLNPTRKTIIMYGIAQAMKFIHSNRIFFRDLSPDNIFLDEKYHPYLSNFNRCIENANDSLLQNDVLNYSIVYIGMFGLIEIIQPNSHENDASKPNTDSILNVISSIKYGAKPRLDDKLDLTEDQKDMLMMMWDQDQNKPAFSDIIQLFENGKLIFTGTNMEEFNEYKQFFSEDQHDYSNKVNEDINEFFYLTNILS